MARWSDLEAGAPELAEAGRALLYQYVYGPRPSPPLRYERWRAG